MITTDKGDYRRDFPSPERGVDTWSGLRYLTRDRGLRSVALSGGQTVVDVGAKQNANAGRPFPCQEQPFCPDGTASIESGDAGAPNCGFPSSPQVNGCVKMNRSQPGSVDFFVW